MVISLLFAAAAEFSLLTYNVAGLPEGLSGSTPSRDTPKISVQLNAYDVVLVQEDFWYHQDLLSKNRHPFRSRPYTERPTVFAIGDGLNQLSRFPFGPLQRTEWKECHGSLSCANDCLAPKGYTFSTLHLPELTVHLYNLHMDAGDCVHDLPTRAQQLEQLAEAIERQSSGVPLIVAGDTNLEDNPGDLSSLQKLLARTGLKDACRMLNCGKEIIDRVLLRGPLEPLSWSTPRVFDGLSDHQAVAVRIRYRQEPRVSSYQ